MSSQTSTKYVIEVRIEIDGIVDKNDVIGATFGQTEGIFSSELDLRELQKTGRIGRIEVSLQHQGNRTVGRIHIPSSMDRFYTALIAAMVESLDKVGPYSAKVVTEKIEDVRVEKRKKIVERARSILYEWEKKKIPEEDMILKELEESLLKAKVKEYGPEKLLAGPDVESEDQIIIVEGRADVLNLVRYGYRNVIGIEGIKIPQSLNELLGKKKRIIAFLDGDRGGDMVLRELSKVIKIDQVARAPNGKEVEDLNAKEIAEALQQPIPLEEALRRARVSVVHERVSLPDEMKTRVKSFIQDIEGNLMGVVLDESLNELAKLPVSELVKRLEELQDFKLVVFDGVITQRLVDAAADKGKEVYLIGARATDNLSIKPNVHILTFEDL
ncbi:MAG: DNA primase DnaG [Aigarchaeota archaeon]|nr:DNA primase DnaG [Aigarchaeota archaeon]MDW8092687.1 DNA primase DnaG [Nitrososphaerota archaeon]